MAETWKATNTEPNQYGETIIVDEHGEGICGVYHREDVPTILAAPLLYEAVVSVLMESFEMVESDGVLCRIIALPDEVYEQLKAARDKAEA